MVVDGGELGIKEKLMTSRLVQVLIDLGFSNSSIDLADEGEIPSLSAVLELLECWAFELGHSEGFQNIAEKVGEGFLREEKLK
jgi:hypothetical protein